MLRFATNLEIQVPTRSESLNSEHVQNVYLYSNPREDAEEFASILSQNAHWTCPD